MATAQTNGSATTISQYGYIVEANNNHGTMTANGSATSNLLDSQPTAAAQAGVYSTVVVDNNSADKALSAGTFAYNNATPTAPKLTTSLAGTSNTFLRSGANDPGSIRSINKLEVVRTRRTTTAIRANKWNEYAGTWESSFPVNTTDNFWDISAGSGVATSTDEAAAPTASVPGELVYLQGNPVPKLDNYKAKTN